MFKPSPVNAAVIIITLVFITAAILFLKKTSAGIYFRITGSNADVLLVRGVSPALYRILSWGVSGFFANIQGKRGRMRIFAG